MDYKIYLFCIKLYSLSINNIFVHKNIKNGLFVCVCRAIRCYTLSVNICAPYQKNIDGL